MKFIALPIFFCLFLVEFSDAQTTISGTVQSLNGEPIPRVVVEANQRGESSLFDGIPDQHLGPDGAFSIELPTPGVYHLTFRGVLHNTIRLPLLVFDQDPIEMNIWVTPKLLNSGRHFDKDDYLHWIRAYGNFNDYDFFSGEIFSKNPDGSISAFIKTDLDTVRYKVRGLTSGTTVLPKADFYDIRGNNSFEAVLINSSERDSIELRYHPQETMPFPAFYPADISPFRVRLRALLSFEDSQDYLWIKPLHLTGLSTMMIEKVDHRDTLNLSPDDITDLMRASEGSMLTGHDQEYRKWIEDQLQLPNLHPQQRSALYIGWAGLLEQEQRRKSFLKQTGEEVADPEYSIDMLREITKQTDPRNPLWSFNSRAATMLLRFSDFDPQIKEYAEEMVQSHQNEMVVREVVLELISSEADQYNHFEEMPYYQWVVERYGENNLARRSIEAFVRAKQE